MTTDPSPTSLSGWKQLRMLPPDRVTLGMYLHRPADLREPWHLGFDLMADEVETMAVESLWIPASARRQTEVLAHWDRWLRATHEAFEPF